MRIRGATFSDIDGVAGLIAEAFEIRPGVGVAYAGVYRALMARDGAVTPDCSRIAEAQGQVVGHALVIPRQMGVCGVPMPAGVVAFVAVRQGARGQGIGRALVEDAIRTMRERGFLVSHLAGSPAFYRRFGYVEAYGKSAGEMPLERVHPYEGRAVVREAVAADAGALHGLFERENAGRTGCIRRDAGQWAWQLEAGHPGGYAACNEGLVGFRATRAACLVAVREGALIGYLRLLAGPGRVLVNEGAAMDEDVVAPLLAHAGEERVLAGRIELSIPAEGALGRWAAEQGATFSEGLDPEALVKTLDAPALLRRLAPVLSERASALRGRSVRLLIETEGDRVALGATPDGVTVEAGTGGADWQVTLPEIGLTQMIFGTRDYAAVIGRGADRGLSDWISALFPVQRPYLYLSARC